MVLALVFTLYFLLLTVMEVVSALHLYNLEGGSLMNAFVLGTITAIYLKGLVVKKSSYATVASLIAASFSTLMILVYLVSGSFSFGMLGILALPHAVKKVR
ncbi:hypothetical protein [Archaeoglobus neptunius]|uniref:hypothetical protein n=1 Tax=Archaeoglobus neptunius TaxID=2798580 RepID=UPI001927EA68|nr:hypothetical protein [Archaeoglobus neptunius]